MMMATSSLFSCGKSDDLANVTFDILGPKKCQSVVLMPILSLFNHSVNSIVSANSDDLTFVTFA